MDCQTITVGDTVVQILHGPAMEEVRRESEGVKWCFHCRKRREFFYIVTAPVGLSYYGPSAEIQCGHCKTWNGDLFPGWTREWE